MQIRSIHHKGLKHFVEDNDVRGIRRDLVDRIRKVLAVLVSAEDMSGVEGHLAGVSISFSAIALEHGVSPYPATGAYYLLY